MIAEHHAIPWYNLPTLDTSGLLAHIADSNGAGPWLCEKDLSPATDPAGLDRTRISTILATSNAALGNPLSDTMQAQLARDAWLVVGGQQPGLLGGPLYAPYKALSAIVLADRLSAQCKRPILPAFWIASEDHDLDEVRRGMLNSMQFTAEHPELCEKRPPVDRVTLQAMRDPMLQQAREALADLPYREETLALLADADWSSYTHHFASILTPLLGIGNIILLDPMQLRELTAPVLSQAAHRFDNLQARLTTGTQTISDAGFVPPLRDLKIFDLAHDSRTAIQFENGFFHLDNERLTPGAMADLIAQHPERFSPSAGLRPLCQDGALPVLLTLGGPAELRYLWQIDPLYSTLNIVRSRLHPRCSATILPAPIGKTLRKAGLPVSDAFTLMKGMDSFLPATNDQPAWASIDAQAHGLAQALRSLALPGREKSVDKAVRSISYQTAKVLRLARDAEAERLGHGRARLQRIRDALFPRGTLQERIESPLTLTARHGLDWPEHISAAIREHDAAFAHHVFIMENL